MKFVDLIKKINLNTPIEIYYDDCECVNNGTAEQIRKMYAWDWFFVNKEIESIAINDRTQALMIILIRN